MQSHSRHLPGQGHSHTTSGQRGLQATSLLPSRGLQVLLRAQKMRQQKVVVTKYCPLPFFPECLPQDTLVSSTEDCSPLDFI